MPLTCLNCNVKFDNVEIQREHYKSEWHRYNLKRRVAGFPPITVSDFIKRVNDVKISESTISQELNLFCDICHKVFNSQNAIDDHLNSKKHVSNLKKLNGNGISPKCFKLNYVHSISSEGTSRNFNQTSAAMTVDNEYDSKNEINNILLNCDNTANIEICIFCNWESGGLVDNLDHMSVAHSFFIPDVEYCVDMEGLLLYLSEKVKKEFICLWCNDHGRTFQSLDAIQKHMRDKGHCRMVHEGTALAEYVDFYDYSSSYPDNCEGIDINEEIQPEVLDGDDYQMVLPSGVIIGHRSLMRYYKQRSRQSNYVPAKSSRKLHKVIAQYRAMGWTPTEQKAAARKARDIHAMKRLRSKWLTKLGVRANKLQHHYREQIRI